MDPLLVFPDPPPPELAQALDLGGWSWKSCGDPDAAMAQEPDEGWAGAVVAAYVDPEAAFALCRRLRKGEMPLEPLLLLLGANQLEDLELRDDLFDIAHAVRHAQTICREVAEPTSIVAAACRDQRCSGEKARFW